MSREKLESMKVNELSKLCKEMGIKHYEGKKRFTKSQMIDAILGAEKSGKVTTKKESAKSNIEIDNQQGAEVEDKVEKESTSTNSDKEMYLENAVIGSLVAFTLPNGKVKSAKIINRSSSKRRFKVETNYGAQYIISYKDVVWVRTGKRWPRGVYNLLKGNDENVKA